MKSLFRRTHKTAHPLVPSTDPSHRWSLERGFWEQAAQPPFSVGSGLKALSRLFQCLLLGGSGESLPFTMAFSLLLASSSPRVQSHSPGSHGCLLLPGVWAAHLGGVPVLPALPAPVSGIHTRPSCHSQPPALQGWGHPQEREVHTHGVQGGSPLGEAKGWVKGAVVLALNRA